MDEFLTEHGGSKTVDPGVTPFEGADANPHISRDPLSAMKRHPICSTNLWRKLFVGGPIKIGKRITSQLVRKEFATVATIIEDT